MPRSGVTPETESCVVEDIAVDELAVHTSHTLSIPHITLQSL